ncbi:hypothetical protein QM806_27655 [Rhodococcus sp. IEGM 1351]|uniref:hypothetical protein n=1 Tax=Rhodococcus sp. IEGM 1351 TaxID=3047089 RepID=UPI0024B85207|nr:hypothetical protein [Rhodococcus sp. IEGM 1351]MDI9939167.1 hypothetical protein [Rhodococcus sp. IEGM 1351]
MTWHVVSDLPVHHGMETRSRRRMLVDDHDTLTLDGEVPIADGSSVRLNGSCRSM